VAFAVNTGIGFHFHLLRHYFTTSLLEKGVDFVTIGSLLGHSKITTSLIYFHTDLEGKRKAVESLEG
jgi:site-specific recombinase XerD